MTLASRLRLAGAGAAILASPRATRSSGSGVVRLGGHGPPYPRRLHLSVFRGRSENVTEAGSMSRWWRFSLCQITPFLRVKGGCPHGFRLGAAAKSRDVVASVQRPGARRCPVSGWASRMRDDGARRGWRWASEVSPVPRLPAKACCGSGRCGAQGDSRIRASALRREPIRVTPWICRATALQHCSRWVRQAPPRPGRSRLRHEHRRLCQAGT